ncbi:MAG TPA: alpha/beta fold hydrolase [Polyangiaceae bacterium]|nr:alpha/beta fold hydrolase [Polyangiaceae bacterium]
MNGVVRLLGVTAAFLLLSFWSTQARADYERRFDVTLRPGVGATLRVTVRENARYGGACVGPTLAFVHGFAHSGATWNPLVDEIFGAGRRGLACKALLLDLPGHGQSSLPRGALFGELLIDDYVMAVIGALAELRRGGLQPTALIGHSMGGLIVEGVQARLLAEGSSLSRRFGIHFAALMSPSAAIEHPWVFAESGAAAAIVGSLFTLDAAKGPVLRVDSATWRPLFFTALGDALAPSAPSAAQIDALGYDFDEAAFAGSQLVGAAPFSRISVGARPFDPRNGTLLAFVSPSQDKFSLREEAQVAYVQLTGDTRRLGFFRVDDAFAVHDMHVSEPRRYLSLALYGWLSGLSLR